MFRQKTLAKILEVGIVPIIRCDSCRTALEAGRAVQRGGIDVLEVTMTVPGALHALEELADELGDEMLLGAGSVLDPETARACMLAGAQFFVTPALDVKTIEICKRYSRVVMPGALTPTEIVHAWEAGADMVKIFPVSNVGGPSYIRALKAPLPQVLMVPTGGVTAGNAADFFQAGASAVAVGSALLKKKAMREGRFEEIEAAAREFLRVMAPARG